jgi:hypothetical protein
MNLFLLNFEDLPEEIVVLPLQKMVIQKYRLEMTFPTKKPNLKLKNSLEIHRSSVLLLIGMEL